MAARTQARRSPIRSDVHLTITGAAGSIFASRTAGALTLTADLPTESLRIDGIHFCPEHSLPWCAEDTITSLSPVGAGVTLTAISDQVEHPGAMTLTRLAVERNVITLDGPLSAASGQFSLSRRKIA